MIQVVENPEDGKFGIVWQYVKGEKRNLGILEVPEDTPLGEYPDDTFESEEAKIERGKKGWF
jgi:hypothetical protein